MGDVILVFPIGFGLSFGRGLLTLIAFAICLAAALMLRSEDEVLAYAYYMSTLNVWDMVT